MTRRARAGRTSTLKRLLDPDCNYILLIHVIAVVAGNFDILYNISFGRRVHMNKQRPMWTVYPMTMRVFFRPPRIPQLTQKPLPNSSQTSVRNASGRRDNVDPKRDTIRRALYPSNIRNTASPTGSWRPDTMRALKKAIPSVEAHETIERAFKLYIRHQRQRRQAELERKYECMRNAMVELEKLDPRLALEANRPEDPRVRTAAETALLTTLRGPEKKSTEGRIRGLFPRELRAPTDTPSKDGWNYDWKGPPSRST